MESRKKLKIVIYFATQWIHGVGGSALWCSVDRQGLSVGIVASTTVVLGRHSGVRATYIDCSLLVAVNVSQPIQKMIDIGWLRSTDTNNLIFGIGCAILTDMNNP
jgi:cbb3-type cytochrome oxidase subunit 1